VVKFHNHGVVQVVVGISPNVRLSHSFLSQAQHKVRRSRLLKRWPQKSQHKQTSMLFYSATVLTTLLLCIV